MNNDLTILIPTSPIPSHPSTKILDETISNIRRYTDARIIIMFDGVHPSLEHRRSDYELYHDYVSMKSELYGACSIIRFPVHNHQSMMTKYVLMNMVKTPLIMFCEHDTSPIGDIPMENICNLLNETVDINYIRFNIFHEIPEEHQYLMIDKEPITYVQVMPGGNNIGVELVRTIQWSQRPHIAKTLWYIKLLNTHFNQHPKSMIEDVMHSVVQTSYSEVGRDLFGLAIYAPQGNQLRSYHADGRGSDVKIIEA